MFTNEEITEARRRMIQAVYVLTAEASVTASLPARNVIYHADELMKSLDAFWSGRDPEAEADVDVT